MKIVPLTACMGGMIARVAPQSVISQKIDRNEGATPGARVDVIRSSPLGDPIQIVLRGSAITLRRQDAKEIYVEAERE